MRTSRVSSLVSGFGGGTIHYPAGTTGTMAAIVVIPGFVSAESSIDWWGPKLASYGFVVMTIDTNTGFDQPASRGRQINNALDYLVGQNTSSSSPVRGMIDTDRLGVIGWSMGVAVRCASPAGSHQGSHSAGAVGYHQLLRRPLAGADTDLCL
ncbi:hypothetical protein ULG90_19060 [Halopseudomonas pachastrellae]|nr:hypothetical protein ULG90_19060 [Halopseudomonas pachastrellae]